MKVVLAVIAAVLVLTIGTTAVALAQDGSTHPSGSPESAELIWNSVSRSR